jgi:hypothetical protein
MFAAQSASKALKGLSFSIAELTLAKAWAEARSLRLVVRLDHGACDEEYKEILAFHVAESQLCQWIVWRNREAVFVQPLIGRTRCYDSVAESIETLFPPQGILPTDIKVIHWPS